MLLNSHMTVFLGKFSWSNQVMPVCIQCKSAAFDGASKFLMQFTKITRNNLKNRKICFGLPFLLKQILNQKFSSEFFISVNNSRILSKLCVPAFLYIKLIAKAFFTNRDSLYRFETTNSTGPDVAGRISITTFQYLRRN